MEKQASIFKIVLGFVLVNVFIWLAFSCLLVIDLIPLGAVPAALRWVMASLSLTASVVLFILYLFLKRRNRPAYFLTVLAFVGLVVLTFADEVGIIDLVYLLIAFTPLVLLLSCRSWYFLNKES